MNLNDVMEITYAKEGKEKCVNCKCKHFHVYAWTVWELINCGYNMEDG